MSGMPLRICSLLPSATEIVAVDANAYYSRPAPRVADGVMQLAHLLHPDSVPDAGLPYGELVGSIFERPKANGRRAR